MKNQETIPAGLHFGASALFCGVLVFLGSVVHESPVGIGVGFLGIFAGLFEVSSAIDDMRHPRRPPPQTKFTPPSDP